MLLHESLHKPLRTGGDSRSWGHGLVGPCLSVMSRKNRKRLSEQELQAASGGSASQPKPEGHVTTNVIHGDLSPGGTTVYKNTVNTKYKEYK